MRPNAEPMIRVGPAGWSYPDWDGIVYPPGRGRSFDPLAYVASYFDLVEINSTFYRAPSRATCRRWVDRTLFNRAFVFTAKAPQEMTHGRRPATAPEVDAFKRTIDPLLEKDRLGAVLLQFPWSFRASSETTAYIDRLTGWFEPFPTAVEVRHGSWGTPRALSFFRDSATALCDIDQPTIGESLAPGSGVPTRDRAYFRLHGRNRQNWFAKDTSRDERYDYLYDVSELSYWRDAILKTGGHARNTYVVLNNHFRGQAVVNALQLRSMLTGRPSPAPARLIAAYPEAKGLSRAPAGREPLSGDQPDGQLDLFGQEEDREHDHGSRQEE